MVLITRNPADAIASHCARLLSNKRKYPILTERRKRVVVQNEIDNYLILIFRFASGNHLKYESLISPETSKQTVVELLSALNVELTGPPLEKVLQINQIQPSFNFRFSELNGNTFEVRSQLSYSDVLSYISS